jgi:hypothetical protein
MAPKPLVPNPAIKRRFSFLGFLVPFVLETHDVWFTDFAAASQEIPEALSKEKE